MYLSEVEAFGYITIEPTACGLPVVLSDRDFFHEVVNNAAIFVDPLSVKSIKVGINEPMTNSVDLKNKGKVRTNYFSFEKFAKSMEEHYVLCLANKTTT